MCNGFGKPTLRRELTPEREINHIARSKNRFERAELVVGLLRHGVTHLQSLSARKKKKNEKKQPQDLRFSAIFIEYTSCIQGYTTYVRP